MYQDISTPKNIQNKPYTFVKRDTLSSGRYIPSKCNDRKIDPMYSQ